MSILDIPIFLFWLIVVVAGYQRGFIGELFSFLMLSFAISITFLVFSYPALIIKNIIGYESKGFYIFWWFLIYIVIVLLLFIIGNRIEEKVKVGFPEDLWNFFGGMFAFVKGFLIFFILFTFIGNSFISKKYNPLISKSFFVQRIQSTEPFMEIFVVPFTPAPFKEPVEKYMKNSDFLLKKYD